MGLTFDPATVSVSDVLLSNPDSVLSEAIKAYNEKDYARSASAYLVYVRYNNSDAISLYNLACCFGLMGDPERAAAFLMASWDKGYRNTEHIKRDTAFDPVRESTVFKAALDEMDKKASEMSEGKTRIYIPAGTLFPVTLSFQRTTTRKNAIR